MNQAIVKAANQLRRSRRSRAKIHGTATRPRLSVHISNRQLVAQLINDDEAKTLVFVTSQTAKVSPTLSARAEWAGNEIAKAALVAKIKRVVFDRGSRRYHGRIKIFAEAARQGGLEF